MYSSPLKCNNQHSISSMLNQTHNVLQPSSTQGVVDFKKGRRGAAYVRHFYGRRESILHEMLHILSGMHKKWSLGSAISAKRSKVRGCCFTSSLHGSLHWPFVLRFGAQGAALHATIYVEHVLHTVCFVLGCAIVFSLGLYIA